MNESAQRLYDYFKSANWKNWNGQMSGSMIEDILGYMSKMPDSVLYVPNYRTGKMMYHRGFDTILGYPPETKVDVPFVINIVHPDDQPFVHYLSQMASEFHLERDKKEPFATMFEINYRVRKYNGDYIMMLRRSTGFLNEGDDPVATLSVMHDIDFMKDVKEVYSKIIGPEWSMKEYRRRLDERKRKQPLIGPFSRRETQVLHMMAQGNKSAEIALQCSVSVHTVNNHRKNMLKKTGLKNTADLVRFGLQNGLI